MLAERNLPQDEWDELLGLVELGFNSAVATGTGKPPAEVMLRGAVKLPIDFMVGTHQGGPAADTAVQVKDIVQAAREHLVRAREA